MSLSLSSSRVFALCTALFMLFLHTLHAAQPLVRIMPLGDSITYGMGAGQAMIPGGYRDPLAHLYAASGSTFLFVGSDATNSTAYLVAGGQQNNEGHTGFRIDQIQAGISGWMDSARPDMVLLHIGTNDILQGTDLGTGGTDTSHAIQRLTTLITTLYAKNPSLKVVLSTLIPIQNTLDAYVKDYNAKLASTVVQPFAAQGKSIVLVDNYANFVNSDGSWKVALFADYAHPDADGYAAMAATWSAVPLPAVEGVIFDSRSAAGAGGEDAAVAVNLIRAGQGTLAGVTAPVGAIATAFPVTGLNDGSTAANGNCTYYAVNNGSGGTLMPVSLTFELDTTVNTGGYDISSVQAITGWGDHNLGAQRFQLYLATNHEEYINYGTYTNAGALDGGNGSYLTTISHSSGLLAQHVTGVRFVFLNPDPSGGENVPGALQAGSSGGTVIRELQAFGSPSSPVSAPPCILTAGSSAGPDSQDGAIAPNLIRQGQSTLAGVSAPTGSLPANFTIGGLNDGSASGNANFTYYSVTDSLNGATVFPVPVTFELNTATNTSGYDISSLQVISGWGDHNLGEQRFQLLLSINHGEYTDYGTYRNAEPGSGGNSGYLSTLTGASGTVAKHVTGIRFIFLNPDRSNGSGSVGASQLVSSGGTLIRELQAFGVPSTAESGGLSYSDWAESTWHLSGDNSLPEADPNHNGIPNLLEYALGGDPSGNASGPSILPGFASSAGAMSFGFTHYDDRTGADLSVQVSSDLSNWSEVAHSVAGGTFAATLDGVTVMETGADHARAVSIRGLPVSGQAKAFVRLRAMSH